MTMLDKNTIFFYADSQKMQDSMAALEEIGVDQTHEVQDGWEAERFATTLMKKCEVQGPATYRKGRKSTLFLAPSARPGWFFERLDLKDQLPVMVSPRNVWNARRSIVLRSGSPDNYIRMTEHIISQRLGMGLDCLTIGMETGDPPLFDVGSLPIVDAVNQAGLTSLESLPLTYWTTRQPVAIMNQNGGFLLFEPAMKKPGLLSLDVAIDFPTAIGKQRIQFDLDRKIYEYGAHARTNCSTGIMLLTKTIGKLFADTRNLGYNWNNILVAGKNSYLNTPAMMHEGKSLEAVWHRACLDLIAALSLLENGRLCGKITSYKAGHALDVQLMTLLMKHQLLTQVKL